MTLADMGRDLVAARSGKAASSVPRTSMIGAATTTWPLRVSGQAPGSTGILDKLVESLVGSKLDPATLMGYPPAVPADWAAQPNGDIKYAFYTEGIDAGFVRGALGGLAVGAGIGAGICAFLKRRG